MSEFSVSVQQDDIEYEEVKEAHLSEAQPSEVQLSVDADQIEEQHQSVLEIKSAEKERISSMGTSEADYTLFQANKVFKETSEVSTNDLGERLHYQDNMKMIDVTVEKSHTRRFP